jgi:hypothetical protein
MEQATCVKLDIEVKWIGSLALINGSAAVRVMAVSLDVHDTMEIGICNRYGHLDAISQTVDKDVWSWKIGSWWWWFRNWYCKTLQF